MIVIWSAVGAEQRTVQQGGSVYSIRREAIGVDKIDVLLILRVTAEAEMSCIICQGYKNLGRLSTYSMCEYS